MRRYSSKQRASAERVSARRILMAGAVAAALLVAMAPLSPSHAAVGAQQDTRSDRARGLYFGGLAHVGMGPCAGHFAVDVRRGIACSHGPDPAPTGVNVTQAFDTTGSTSTVTSSGSVQCTGDGVSGPRVQAIYAVASDVADRYTSVAPYIAQWAGEMDGAVSQSAAETGGDRHIRFVTNADCTLNIAHVTLSPSGDDSFSNTINELTAKGYNLTTRKYLIWTDANVYCGIAEVAGDDRADASNPANMGPDFARVDSGCWGRSDHLSELHELMHTLGAVQLSAPHATANYHCTDEYDAMCYADTSSVTLTYPCDPSHEWLLDCNHDDYFSTAPPSGSYLATHWDAANSVFLDNPAAATPTAPTSTSTTLSGSISAKKPSVSFALAVGAGNESSTLQFTTSGKTKTGALRLRLIGPNGSVVTDTTGASPVNSTAMVGAGTYTWQVSGSGSASFSLTVTYVAP